MQINKMKAAVYVRVRPLARLSKDFDSLGVITYIVKKFK